MKNIDLRKLLIKLGISSNLKGFHYIIESVNIIRNQKKHIRMTDVYKKVSKSYENTPNAVERAIRHAIDKSYKENNFIKKIYSFKPDNSAFLYDLALNFDIFLDIIKGVKDEKVNNDIDINFSNYY